MTSFSTDCSKDFLKCKWYGSSVVVADRFFASSKTCSECGHVRKTFTLSERVFSCERCSLSIDRGLNAAINLSGLAASSAESINACGNGVRRPSSSRDGATAMHREMNALIPNGISG
ncbi:MAG: transposase [Thermoplasmata archaeon]|nr:transposase [Candidatus Sysuiplasma acidicola]MBX8646866.1 transposase [Candidatus Sysuiplasma acidicola]